MKVHNKLNQARMKLQNTKLNKSGHNKFAGYTYFELGDFLPTVNNIFNELGLCGVVRYGKELATLTITDIEDGASIEITSPMAEANLKGCHPIQNLGAVETYTRRYLWVTALEIVEHDALDSSQPVVEKETFNLAVWVANIESQTTIDSLQKTYLEAKEECIRLNDAPSMKGLNAATSKRKEELSK